MQTQKSPTRGPSAGEREPDFTLTLLRDEPRADTRVLAQHLGILHRSVFRLVSDYRPDFEAFGKVRFENAPSSSGQSEKFALLNEDQAFLLLTYSRNSVRVRALKVRLVRAFADARRAAELHNEYLPTYRDLHNQMHRLAQGSSSERWAHANLNKLVNRTAGIESGQRARADVPRKAMLIAAQHIATVAMQGAADHHDGYERAKAALAPLTIKRVE